jgi:hypothetical protein
MLQHRVPVSLSIEKKQGVKHNGGRSIIVRYTQHIQ